MAAKPVHPSSLKRIPMRYTAEIVTHHGWWYRYSVRRLYGIGIPEKANSYHRTLEGAQRAARRWRRRNKSTPDVIDSG